MKKAIKKLKNSKSAGEDNIINEVLKTGILFSGTNCKVDEPDTRIRKYLLKWTKILLITLYKGGLTDEPDNYGGISISSCLSKLLLQCFTLESLRSMKIFHC